MGSSHGHRDHSQLRVAMTSSAPAIHSWQTADCLLPVEPSISQPIGLPNASIYNPFTDTWHRVPDMNAGRWYPTATTLANGDVLVVSGRIDVPSVKISFPKFSKSEAAPGVT